MKFRVLLFLHLMFPTFLFGLTDQSQSLEAVLENGTLSKVDCDRYFQGETDRDTTLRCGKYMFFFDSMGVPGFPAALVDLIRTRTPNNFGKSFEKLGMIQNPFSFQHLPVGLSDGPRMVPNIPTYTVTCASCHFGKTSGGRYVVGQPNHDFDFRRLTLAISVFSEMALTPKKTQPKEVQDLLQDAQEEFFGVKGTKFLASLEVLKLIPNVIAKKIRPMTDQEKIFLAANPPGVFDPFAAPGPDDKVSTPLRILPLYDITLYDDTPHGAMLGSGGGTPDFAHVFTALNRVTELLGYPVDKYPMSFFVPLAEYIKTLKAPKNLESADPLRVESGKKLFQQKCSVCHDRADYSGSRLFRAEEIGTDSNLTFIIDPEVDGTPMFDMVQPYELTAKVRAGHLQGIWSYKRILHNGSLTSLEELFCLNGPRPRSSLVSGHSTAGHSVTCDLPKEEKVDLLQFVKTF